MKDVKVNINRKRLTDKEIEAGKDFQKVLADYNSYNGKAEVEFEDDELVYRKGNVALIR